MIRNLVQANSPLFTGGFRQITTSKYKNILFFLTDIVNFNLWCVKPFVTVADTLLALRAV